MDALEPDCALLGALIRKRREEKGLTQQQLANTIGVSERHYSDIENCGVNPGYKLLFKIVRELELSTTSVFYPELSVSEKQSKYLNELVETSNENEKKLITRFIEFIHSDRQDMKG